MARGLRGGGSGEHQYSKACNERFHRNLPATGVKNCGKAWPRRQSTESGGNTQFGAEIYLDCGTLPASMCLRNFCEVLNVDIARNAESAEFEVGSAEHRRG